MQKDSNIKGKVLQFFMRMIASERDQLLRMKEKYKLEKSLDTVKIQRKPFFWVDLEKLRKMKQFCEQQSKLVQ